MNWQKKTMFSKKMGISQTKIFCPLNIFLNGDNSTLIKLTSYKFIAWVSKREEKNGT